VKLNPRLSLNKKKALSTSKRRLQKTAKVFKCDVGGGWRISDGPILMRNEVLQRANEERNILNDTKIRKISWIGHNMPRNCLLKQVLTERFRAKLV
jgi:hypothetical protein